MERNLEPTKDAQKNGGQTTKPGIMLCYWFKNAAKKTRGKTYKLKMLIGGYCLLCSGVSFIITRVTNKELFFYGATKTTTELKKRMVYPLTEGKEKTNIKKKAPLYKKTPPPPPPIGFKQPANGIGFKPSY
jgi:hypothetical protein